MYENVWWPIYIPDKDPFSIDFIDFYLLFTMHVSASKSTKGLNCAKCIQTRI